VEAVAPPAPAGRRRPSRRALSRVRASRSQRQHRRPVARAASTAPATAADPFAVTPVVTTHTPGYVPIALTAGSILLALLISQIGGRLESRSAARSQAVIRSKGWS
jgi:hypothetical protein